MTKPKSEFEKCYQKACENKALIFSNREWLKYFFNAGRRVERRKIQSAKVPAVWPENRRKK